MQETNKYTVFNIREYLNGQNGELGEDDFNSAIDVLQTLVIALGAGLGIWGVINLLEGYGNDNPGANAHVR